jgi:hypothetical protein
VLERITYANEETGYTMADVDTGRGASDLLTVSRIAGQRRAAGRYPCAASQARARPRCRSCVNR